MSEPAGTFPAQGGERPGQRRPIEDWGETVDPSAGPVPVVYHFRPTRYVKVAPEKLQEWEDYFIENVGLKPDVGASAEGMALANRSACMSASEHGWDDCDYV